MPLLSEASLYIGDQPVSAVYLGSDLVWQQNVPAEETLATTSTSTPD